MRSTLAMVVSCFAILMALATLLQWPRGSLDGFYVLTPRSQASAVVGFHRGRFLLYYEMSSRDAFSRGPAVVQPFSFQTKPDYQIASVPFTNGVSLTSQGIFHAVSYYSAPSIQFMIPLWVWLIVGVPLPAMETIRFFRTDRRKAKGPCSICGYDLRASPERCPECGSAVTPKSTSSLC